MEKQGKRRILAVGASCVAVGVVAATLMGMGPGGGGGGMGGGAPGGRGGAQEETTQTTVVETSTPTMGDIVVTGSFVGTVEPGQQVTVYPKVSGEVLLANFQVGDTVEAGSVLFQVDSTTVEYNIAQTQANLANARARADLSLEIAQQDLETYSSNVDEGLNSTLLQAEASVTNAEIALQTANNNYRTARQNYIDYVNGDTDSDYSDSQRDTLRNARVTAELAVESAQQSLENAKASLEATKKAIEDQKVSAENSVKSAELSSDLTADQISLQQLQRTLQDYTITAPIGGVIEQKNVDAYDMASTQTAAYVISNKDMITVSFHVAETSLTYMQAGNSVTLEKEEQTATGVITEVSTMVDSGSGLYEVKATVQNAPFELRSGSTILLYADTQRVENEMMIPIDAVYYESGEPFVYVFENNTANKTFIETGISDAGNIQVKSGLSYTDSIIVTWSANLFDGAEVYLPGTAPVASSPAEEEGEGGQGGPGGDDAPADGSAEPEGDLPGSPGDPEDERPGGSGDSEGILPDEFGDPEGILGEDFGGQDGDTPPDSEEEEAA